MECIITSWNFVNNKAVLLKWFENLNCPYGYGIFGLIKRVGEKKKKKKKKKKNFANIPEIDKSWRNNYVPFDLWIAGSNLAISSFTSFPTIIFFCFVFNNL